MNETTRLIRVSIDLLDSFGTRTADGRLLAAEWGDPVASCGVEPGLVMDIYEPTFTATDDGMTLVSHEAVRDRAPCPEVEPLRTAVKVFLAAEAEPAYSWVIESQAARAEGRPNREVERMDRIRTARAALRVALATSKPNDD